MLQVLMFLLIALSPGDQSMVEGPCQPSHFCYPASPPPTIPHLHNVPLPFPSPIVVTPAIFLQDLARSKLFSTSPRLGLQVGLVNGGVFVLNVKPSGPMGVAGIQVKQGSGWI